MTDPISRRVARGAASLDVLDPAWFHRVNLRDLNASRPGSTAPAQVFGTYATALRELGLRTFDDEVRFGLIPHQLEKPHGYADLTRCWAAEVNRRLRTANRLTH